MLFDGLERRQPVTLRLQRLMLRLGFLERFLQTRRLAAEADHFEVLPLRQIIPEILTQQLDLRHFLQIRQELKTPVLAIKHFIPILQDSTIWLLELKHFILIQ